LGCRMGLWPPWSGRRAGAAPGVSPAFVVRVEPAGVEHWATIVRASQLVVISMLSAGRAAANKSAHSAEYDRITVTYHLGERQGNEVTHGGSRGENVTPGAKLDGRHLASS
jgi:hypothetical protein